MKEKPTIHVAVPALNEMEYFPDFIKCITAQCYTDFKLHICINQPEEWWEDKNKLPQCLNNQQSITYLKDLHLPYLTIIDKSSQGKGWKNKKYGVGWARKTTMDSIAKIADQQDIIVSLDVDATFGSKYFESIIENFNKNKKAVALAVPYYHQLTDDEIANRQILRYEIYMRYYGINLWRIGSPYHFTAIGSAIALPVKAYKAIGGITPHLSGEDFYFLQKLRKYGEVLIWNSEKVYPAARYSSRVVFGTGPAMIKGSQGDWSTYPIFSYEYFDEIKKTFELFEELYSRDIATPMDEFFLDKFGNINLWQPLRKNFKTKEQFIRACHHKIDAFRVFQYLKWRHNEQENRDEFMIIQFLNKFYKQETKVFNLDNFSFQEASIDRLNDIRNLLVRIEEGIQINNITD